jgi:flotillin
MQTFDALDLLQGELAIEAIPWTLVGAGLAGVLFLGMVMLFVSRYKRCPANKILVISGKVGSGEVAKCLLGGGAFVSRSTTT